MIRKAFWRQGEPGIQIEMDYPNKDGFVEMTVLSKEEVAERLKQWTYPILENSQPMNGSDYLGTRLTKTLPHSLGYTEAQFILIVRMASRNR